ncbi:hypothetical protein L1987_32581 [Smallanthus sonchifolius]|uniref:Uncharacterized protein n=1 Tax=Smallanthus sonchifolius TaxID=185202 RepID=A0ACB9HNM0_9ASTR|nr:hypothetical protein L1987_32581 [Smallanthus sonchifolius]
MSGGQGYHSYYNPKVTVKQELVANPYAPMEEGNFSWYHTLPKAPIKEEFEPYHLSEMGGSDFRFLPLPPVEAYSPQSASYEPFADYLNYLIVSGPYMSNNSDTEGNYANTSLIRAYSGSSGSYIDYANHPQFLDPYIQDEYDPMTEFEATFDDPNAIPGDYSP